MRDLTARDAAIALYRHSVTDPSVWQDTARDLVLSANKLRAQLERRVPLGFGRARLLSAYETLAARHYSMTPAIVLYAYAAENLLKGLLVAQGVEPVAATGRLKKDFATHSLQTLARRAGVHGLSGRLLDQLTEFASSGKYPVGIDPGAGFHAHSYFPSAVLSGIDQLLPKLEQAVAGSGHPKVRPAIDPMRLGRRPQPRRTTMRESRRRPTRG